MERFELIAPCHFGLEAVMKREILDLGYEVSQVEDGRVTFIGDAEAVCRANIFLRTTERILLKVGSFKAETFEELFQGVKALPWEGLLGKEDAFPVTGSSLSSQLHSVPDCQAIIKKAIVERLKAKYKLSWFAESGALHRVRFRILKDQVSVLVDTSGEGIYGVKFLLYDEDRNPIGEFTSDDEGWVYITADDLPDGANTSGRFYLRELEAAEGYILDE